MRERICLNILWFFFIYRGSAVDIYGCSILLISYRVIDEAPKESITTMEAEAEDEEGDSVSY